MLVIEDVWTTGGSTRETIGVVGQEQGLTVAAGAIIDRSAGKLDLNVPTLALLELEVASYEPDDCPLCRAGSSVCGRARACPAHNRNNRNNFTGILVFHGAGPRTLPPHAQVMGEGREDQIESGICPRLRLGGCVRCGNRSLFALAPTRSVAQSDSKHPGTLESGGRTRTYFVHTPPGFQGDEKLPLVMVLHGGGGNADNAEKMSGMSDKADAANFLVVYPDGTGGMGEHFHTWNSGNCCALRREK